jgi:hypothetical protein
MKTICSGRKPKSPAERLQLIFLTVHLCRKQNVSNTYQLSKKLTEQSDGPQHARAWESALRCGYKPRAQILNSAFQIEPSAKTLFDNQLWQVLRQDGDDKNGWLKLFPSLSISAQSLIHEYLLSYLQNKSSIELLFDFLTLEIKEAVACLILIYKHADSKNEKCHILIALFNSISILLTIEPFFSLRRLFILYIKAFVTNKSLEKKELWKNEFKLVITKSNQLSSKTTSVFTSSESTPKKIEEKLKLSALVGLKENSLFGTFSTQNDLLSGLKLSSIVSELDDFSEKLPPPDLREHTIASLFREITISPLNPQIKH